MKVLGWTEEVTVCDCCGKSNISGTFGVETDAGDVLHYGSVCVNNVYGRKQGEQIKSLGKYVANVKTLPWSRVVDLYSRGYFPNTIIAFIGDKIAMNNATATMAAVDSFRFYPSREVIRSNANI